MNCEECRNLISGYIDDELTPDQKEQFESHLAQCRACSSELEELLVQEKFLIESEDFLPDEVYWAGFDTRLTEKIQGTKPVNPFLVFFNKTFRRVRWVAVALLVLMAVLSPVFLNILAPKSEKIKAPSVSRKNEDIREDSSREIAGEPAPVIPMEARDEPEKETPSAPAEEPEPVKNEIHYKYARPRPDKEARAPKTEISAGNSDAKPTAPSTEKKEKAKVEAGASRKTTTYTDNKDMNTTAKGFSTSRPREEKPIHTRALVDKIKHRKPDRLEEDLSPESSYLNQNVGSEVMEKDFRKTYIAQSKVLIIKLVNLDENGEELEILRESIRDANFVEVLEGKENILGKDPELKEHIEVMQDVTNQILTVKSNDLASVKKKVLENNLLEKTLEM